MHRRRRLPSRWSDLPSELLSLVFEKLSGELDDVISCANVCASWRSVMESLNNPLKRSKPFIILGEETPNVEPPKKVLHLFDAISTKSYEIHLPQLGDKWIHECSNGWLLTIASQFPHETSFLNPITQSEVKLPSLREQFERGFRVITSSRNLSDQDCVVLGAVLDPRKGPNALLFCHPRSKAWKKVIVDVEVDGIIWHDIMLHKNQFYAASNKFLYRISFEGHAKKLIPLPRIQEDATIPLYKTNFYLVELSGELLLVVMRHRGLGHCLKLYKLRFDGKKIWIEIEHLGRNGIYLGRAHSVAVIAQEDYYNYVIFIEAEMLYGFDLKYGWFSTWNLLNLHWFPRRSTKPIQWFTL